MATVAIHVARCETCRTAATRPSIHPGTGPSTYGEAIHRVARRAGHRATQHELDKRTAFGALDQILALPTEEWNRAIRSSPRYHSYAFAQYALATCKATWSDNPHRSERLAQLALEVANRLSNKEHGRRNLHDLRATAWAYVANCRRIRSAYFAVPDALQRAAECLRSGTGDERDRAGLLSVTTSFLVSTGRFDETIAVCAEVEKLSRDLKAPVLQVKNLLLLSRLYDLESRPERALAITQRAGALLGAPGAPRLAALQRVNLALQQAEAGNPKKGLAVIRSIGAAQRQALSKLNRMRLTWTDATIRWKLGNLEEAVALLRGCRNGFEDAQTPCDAALVNLEMARIYIELGQTQQARKLSGEALFSFSCLGVERDTLLALDIFRQTGGFESGSQAEASGSAT